jgi:hypothetical protein
LAQLTSVCGEVVEHFSSQFALVEVGRAVVDQMAKGAGEIEVANPVTHTERHAVVCVQGAAIVGVRHASQPAGLVRAVVGIPRELLCLGQLETILGQCGGRLQDSAPRHGAELFERSRHTRDRSGRGDAPVPDLVVAALHDKAVVVSELAHEGLVGLTLNHPKGRAGEEVEHGADSGGGLVQGHHSVAAESAHQRIDNTLHRHSGHHGIHGVAAVAEDLHGGIGDDRLRTDDGSFAQRDRSLGVLTVHVLASLLQNSLLCCRTEIVHLMDEK